MLFAKDAIMMSGPLTPFLPPLFQQVYYGFPAQRSAEQSVVPRNIDLFFFHNCAPNEHTAGQRNDQAGFICSNLVANYSPREALVIHMRS
jgi:hypothetical protein